jgi:hypothetical protein
MFLVCVTSDRIFFFLKGHVSGSGQPHTCMCMTMHGLAWFLHEHTKVCTSGRGVGEKLPARLLVLSCNRTYHLSIAPSYQIAKLSRTTRVKKVSLVVSLLRVQLMVFSTLW